MQATQHTIFQAEQQAVISLIIPVYNVERYIAECLESAIGQSFPHLEIICVDDRGDDASMSIVEAYAARDKRIRIVRNKTNMGLAASRNEGIMHSGAPFIMCLDSDDSYEPSMCEKMHEALVSSGADLAVCGVRFTYEADASHRAADEHYYALKWKGLQRVSDEVEDGCNVNAWNKIYRRDFLERFEIQFPVGLYYEDAYFFHACMAHAKTIMFVNEKLYHYRRRKGSIMNRTFAKNTSMSIDHVKIAMSLHAYYRQWQLLERKFDFFCRFFVHYVDIALRNRHSEQEEDNILCLAGRFVREHIRSTAGLEGGVASRIEQLRHAFPQQTKGTILQVVTKPLQRSYRFLGIPLYNIRYSPRTQKHYLLGVQIHHKPYVS